MFRVPRSHRRRPAGPAALLLAAATLAGTACSGGDDAGESTTAPPTTAAASPGSAAPTTTAADPGTTAPAPATTAAPVSPRCRTADLQMEVGDSGSSAGHWHAMLLFTNAGTAPCTLEGYPGVSFLDAAGAPVGQPAGRLANTPSPVVLAPGERAHAALNVSNAYNFGEDCGPPVATATVRVFPPDETADLQAPLDTDVCPNLAMVDVGPVFAGVEAAAGEDGGA